MDRYVPLLINCLLIENEKQLRNGVYGYTQRTMTYNSNKIEGSTLTKDQINSLFETRTLKTDTEFVRAKDVEEATGHFIMFNTMLNTYNENISEKLIKDYHYALKSGVFEDKASGFPIGEYKNRANIVSDMKTVSPLDVPKYMQRLIENYVSKDDISMEDICIFHVQYEKIHPFQDGNGRTGRIIMYKECLKNNIFPFIIEDEYKSTYYECLRIAQTEENYKPLEEFFVKEQKRYFDYVIDLIKDASIDFETNDGDIEI